MFDFSISAKRDTSNAKKYQWAQSLFGTKNVLPMWVADMDIDTPTCVIEALKQRLQLPNFGYEEITTSGALEAQLQWLKQRHQLNFNLDDLFVFPSTTSSIFTVIRAVTDHGDKIIVQPPVYRSFFESIEKIGRQMVMNPLKRDPVGNYTFNLDDLRAKIDDKTKLLILCSPHNPVGKVWRKQELADLLAICLENNVLVFSDEVHADLTYLPHRHQPFMNVSDEAKKVTFTGIGIGKTFNLSGFSLSTLAVSDPKLKRRLQATYAATHFGKPSVLSSVAMRSAYQYGESWLVALLQHLSKNVQQLMQVCHRHADKISVIKPEATYLAWLDCRSMALSQTALQKFFVTKAKLGLSDGLSFSPDPRDGTGFMRLNFGVSSDIMIQAMQQLDTALSSF